MYSLNSTLTSAEELCLGEEKTQCEQQQRRPQLGHGDGGDDGVSGPGLGPVLQRPSLYVATSSVIRGYGGYNGLARGHQHSPLLPHSADKLSPASLLSSSTIHSKSYNIYNKVGEIIYISILLKTCSNADDATVNPRPTLGRLKYLPCSFCFIIL